MYIDWPKRKLQPRNVNMYAVEDGDMPILKTKKYKMSIGSAFMPFLACVEIACNQTPFPP